MTRTIRIEDDVYEGLKELASPFEDTPNTVIRKLLEEKGILPSSKQTSEAKFHSPRKRKGKLTPQFVYEEWLTYILWHELGGKATRREAAKATIEAMQKYNLLSDADFEEVSTGEPRAENTIAWGRNKLKENGIISRDSQFGIWELTEKGIQRAKELDPPKVKK